MDTTLFTVWSEDWQQEMPTILFTHVEVEADGTPIQDIVIQTGDHHWKAWQLAKEFLNAKGLDITEQETMTGPTGCYYNVIKLENK